jgi:hypothetical protein
MLLEEIEKGLIQAKRSWLRDIPLSWKHRLGPLPGELDPRHTEIGISELVKFAFRHNLKPDFLAHLMTVQTALDRTNRCADRGDLRVAPSIDTAKVIRHSSGAGSSGCVGSARLIAGLGSIAGAAG